MSPAGPSSSDLVAAAERLRSLHVPGDPLVLANAWDAASARLVADAGHPVIATSSVAVAMVHGHPDDDTMPPDVGFAAVAEITRVARDAGGLPVTADLEAGYGLDAAELVARLTGAGAVGCNLEDSDHHGPGDVVEAEAHAARVASVRAAADAAGVPIVVNARIDLWARGVGASPADRLTEGVRRARLYLDAGADCVYPILLADQADIASFVEQVGAPVNVHLTRDLPASRLAELGVARASMGGGLFRAAQKATAAAIAAL
jgi:2-methylisocitrate lyase-like PEP mutase family enzyme